MRSNPHSNAQRSTFNAQRSTLKDSLFTIRDSRPAPRAAFTILELMMVIGVLSVLLAIILPTIKTVRAATLRKQASVEATALAQAAIRYKTEYGFWPGQLEVKSASDATVKLRSSFDIDENTWISGIISRYENTGFTVESQAGSPPPIYIDDNYAYRAFSSVGQKSGVGFEPNPLNPKGIRFIDLINEGDSDHVSHPDPWGREYILIMGLNPRSTFTHTVTAQGVSYSVSISNTIAFAFSLGPEGDQSTNYIYSAGVR